MKFSTAVEVMTPEKPVFLSGFSDRRQKCTGVHDNIFIRMILIQQTRNLVILSLDITGADRSFVDGIKKEVNKVFGIPREDIIINFSHSHSSIFLSGEDTKKRQDLAAYYRISHDPRRNNQYKRNYDDSEDVLFYQKVRSLILGMVDRCFKNLEEGELRVSRGETGIGISRRLKTREGVVWAPNYLGEIDRQLIVLRFVNHEGHTRGVIFNCACHPSGLNFDNYLLSAEFPGYACKKIEAEYEGATAIFLQGCAGEIKPIQCVNARKDGFKSYSFEECEEAGLELAGDVLRIMNDGEFDKIDYNERTVISDLRIYSHVWSHEMLKAHRRWIQESPELNRRLRETMDALRKGAPKYFIQCYVCVWDLGNGFRIITIEGEPESRLGKKIKEFIGEDTTMVLGYSNGVQTYINSIETQREGNSYERDSFLEINLSGPIVEEAEYILLGYVGEVARNLNWPGSR